MFLTTGPVSSIKMDSSFDPLDSDNYSFWKDPIETCKRLEEHFRSDFHARVIGLTDEFFMCRMNAQEEKGLYTARIQSIVNQLKDTGRPIEE
ncbi:uncharacterized protein TNIN_87741 [Trichonephila inaurata madagascariensis]|uniref:Gag protein n=1 Tax=Trichonephila inaurata madagascariensis TaxID=2747483 RepID=A0A8X6YJI6_9ARAC|nr:uncharacterized protein TNIN_87741 [Trichonephila inaurata madagascariensis]